MPDTDVPPSEVAAEISTVQARLAPGRLRRSGVAALGIRSASVLSRSGILLLAAALTDPRSVAAAGVILAVSEIARVWADFGVDAFSLREFTKRSGADPQLVRSVFGTKLALGATAAIILWILMPLMLSEEAPSLWPMALLPLSQLLLSGAVNLAHARSEAAHLAPPAVIGYMAVAAGYGFFAYLKVDPFWDYTILIAAELIVVWRELGASIVSRFKGLRVGEISALLRAAAPIGISLVLVIVYVRLDQLMVNRMLPNEEFGLYVFAARFTEPPYLLIGSWITSMVGVYVAKWELGHAEFDQAVAKLLMRAAFTGLIVSALVGGLGITLVHTFVSQYRESSTALAVLAAAATPRIINSALTVALIASSRERAIPGIAIANGVTIAILLAILVPTLGIAGAALAILASECANSGYQFFALKRKDLRR